MTPTTSCLPAISKQTLVPAGTTIQVDNAVMTSWGSVKWLVVLSAVDNSLIRSFEVYADHEYGTLPDFNVYAIMGSTIAHSVNVIASSGQLQLQITNNEAIDLIAYTTRIGVPLTTAAYQSIQGVSISDAHYGIAPSNTKIVDTFQYWGVQAVKWIVTVTDPMDNKITSQVFAMMKSGLIGEGVEYALIGDISLNYNITVNANINMVELVVTNNDTVNMFVDVTRIPVEMEKPPTCNSPVSDVNIWVPNQVTIPSGVTSVVDSNITIPGHNAVKWLVYVRQPATNRSGAFELAATRQQLSNVSHVLYSIISKYFDIDVTTSIVNLDMVLSVKNNELNPVTINVIRVPVSV
ncbi:MAG: hypothetical protein CTY12_00020 [Methylotenera sp.]|nr:MAG: hypothetical protein CTY12_00020 [Methylotenera sp.]